MKSISHIYADRHNASQDDLQQLHSAGLVIRHTAERLDNGFYCGTEYRYYNLDGSKIHTFFCPSGFGINGNRVRLEGPLKTKEEVERIEREAEVAFFRNHPELNP